MIDFFLTLHPSIIVFLAMPFVPLFRSGARTIFVASICAISLLQVVFLWKGLPFKILWNTPIGELAPFVIHLNDLSFPFAFAFCGMAILGLLYGWKSVCVTFHQGSLVCLGSTLIATFAGDAITIFIALEILFMATLVFICAGGDRSHRPALRYSLYQMISGFCALAGALCLYHETGSWFISSLDLTTWAGLFFFFSLGIKVAFPLLHPWLQDAYPSASLTGSVLLSAFSTKLGILLLCKLFAGVWLLIPIGIVMTLFPIPYAAIENRMRRVLAYSLNNQLGFMVAAIGLGTPLAIAGATAHAFTHIFYKGLLFMTVGSAIAWAGSGQATRMGGLFRKMPIAGTCCMIGAASISAVPFFSGFISKSLILGAFYQQHEMFFWTLLLLASVGVLEHSGIKIPVNCFFGEDKAQPNAPHVLPSLASNIAMIITAFICVGIGIFPWLLYQILPFSVENNTGIDALHIVLQMQLLTFAMLAFVLLNRLGLYPSEQERHNWDVDIIWRRTVPYVWDILCAFLASIVRGIKAFLFHIKSRLLPIQKILLYCYFYVANQNKNIASRAIIGATLFLLLSLALYFFR